MIKDSAEIAKDWDVVIGLEVHIQLATEGKLFCDDPNDYSLPPNTAISAVSLAYPGAMPVLNKKALELAVILGKSCHCDISEVIFFDRKNYFYPDLPKGYQITQDSTPICKGGSIPVKLKGKYEQTVQLNRIHLEEDAGKSMHSGDAFTRIDFNRAGVPLLEMVTEPVLTSAESAASFLQEIRRLVRFLGVGDGNMQEGSLRCDANISLKRPGETVLGKKVEIKNLNSFKFLQKALEYEIRRQSDLLENNLEVVSETRLYDSDRNITEGMRDKEDLNDYRYFPDPDLSPVHLDKEWIKSVEATLPGKPWEIEKSLMAEGVSQRDAEAILEDRELYDLYNKLSENLNGLEVIKWLMGPVKSWQNRNELSIRPLLDNTNRLSLIMEANISQNIPFNTVVKEVFDPFMNGITSEGSNSDFQIEGKIASLKAALDSGNNQLREIVATIIQAHPKEAEALSNGKKKLEGMFMGKIMKEAKGKIDPKLARELLYKELKDK